MIAEELLRNNFIENEERKDCWHYKPKPNYNFHITDGEVTYITEGCNYHGITTHIITLHTLLEFLIGLK